MEQSPWEVTWAYQLYGTESLRRIRQVPVNKTYKNRANSVT